MKGEINGARIFDKKDSFLSVSFLNVLNEIDRIESFKWSLLYFKGAGYLKDGTTILDFEENIHISERGLFVNSNKLKDLANEKIQFYEVLLVGCKDIEKIVRYADDQEMYERCDIVIEMIDSSYWEVFSTDKSLIRKLLIKFKETELLELNRKSGDIVVIG